MERNFRVAPDAEHRTADVFGADTFVDASSSENPEEVNSGRIATVAHVESVLVQFDALIRFQRDVFLRERQIRESDAQNYDQKLHINNSD